MASFTRAELLALTPARYLADGYTTAEGAPRPGLKSEYATAASTRFLAAQLSPQELSLTAEAIRQVLPLHTGTTATRMHETLAEALAVIANAIRQPNNPALADWLGQCTGAIRTPADLDAFLQHLLATERQYAMIAALTPDPAATP